MYAGEFLGADNPLAFNALSVVLSIAVCILALDFATCSIFSPVTFFATYVASDGIGLLNELLSNTMLFQSFCLGIG